MTDTPNNNKEFASPSWIDNAFLEKVLISGENDSMIKVTSSEVKRATVDGDNYGSDMYRAAVKISRGGQEEDRSIIIKSAKDATVGEMNKFLQQSKFFEREIDIFSLAHPELYRLLNKVSFTAFKPFAAKYLYSQKPKVIILEDLKKENFKLAASNFGLDLSHCLLVIETIARYHAASVVLHEENPDLLKPFLEKSFSIEQIKSFAPMMKNNMSNIGKEVNTWPGYEGRYSNKFYEIGETSMEKWHDEMERDDSSFNVLIHGDLWMNNMMFRYSEDTGDVTDVRFVDFQLSYWTSPAIDLQYFLNSSASPEVLEKFDMLIEKYHSVLCKTLELLEYKRPPPTLHQIQAVVEKKSIFGIIAACATRTIALADRNKVPDFNKIITDEESIHLSEKYKASLKKIITFYEKRGWL